MTRSPTGNADAAPARATGITRPLAFASDVIDAALVEGVRDHPIEEGIVVNLSSDPVVCGGPVPSVLPPWRSTWLRGVRIGQASRLAVIHVRRQVNLGGVTLSGWQWFGERAPDFPRDTPLYISPQDVVGPSAIDAAHFVEPTAAPPDAARPFELRLNLWWAPAHTDCVIHNEHRFLEIHTQIHGIGQMQKFRSPDPATLYEDVTMAPGLTHGPFLAMTGPQMWEYPWHRYYATTDCIWLAIELHPADTRSR